MDTEEDEEFEQILSQFSLKLKTAAVASVKRKLKPNIGSKWLQSLQKRIKQGDDSATSSTSRKKLFDSPQSNATP